MKKYAGIWVLGIATTLFLLPTSCTKNNVSPIPSIYYMNMYPDSVKAGSGKDTVYIQFHLQDGDADLGNDPNSTNYDLFIKDSRYDTFQGYFFPPIASQVEDPKKGIEGTCIFQMLGALIIPRQDSIHMKQGDTTSFELYITDRAGHKSNHITTPKLYIRP